MFKTLFTLAIVFAIAVFIVHKGWHKNMGAFADKHQGTATTIVKKSKAVVHEAMKSDTIVVIQKTEK
jgi:hypothetical protein